MIPNTLYNGLFLWFFSMTVLEFIVLFDFDIFFVMILIVKFFVHYNPPFKLSLLYCTIKPFKTT